MCLSPNVTRTRLAQMFCLMVSLGTQYSDLQAQSNVWEKLIPTGRRLVVSRIEIDRAEFSRRVTRLIEASKHIKVPDHCYTYFLDLYETDGRKYRRLWERDLYEYDKKTMDNYIEETSLHMRVLDVCYDEFSSTSVVVMKQQSWTKAEVSRSSPKGTEIVSNSDTNLLKMDLWGSWFTQAAKIDCSETNKWRITLSSSDSKTSSFCWQGGKWVPQDK
jgi:hypothetical protein